MAQVIIEMTDDEITVLETKFVSYQDWIDNFATNKARVVMEERRKKDDWPDLRDAAIAGGVVLGDNNQVNGFAIYAHAVSVGTIKTAAQLATEADAAAAAEQAAMLEVDPLDVRINKRQVGTALILAGISTEPLAFIRNGLEQLTDPTEKALALNAWDAGESFGRTDPLFHNADIMNFLGLTSDSIDSLWAIAVQQAR